MPPDKKRFSWGDVHTLFYITHINNIPSIFKHGIVSHAELERRGIQAERIYNNEVVERRQFKLAAGKSLWEYANLYFQVRNPMLFQVLRRSGENHEEEIVVLGVDPSVLNSDSALVSIGNAAADASQILDLVDGQSHIGSLQKTFKQEYWNATDGSKRTIMAELLVPTIIPSHAIRSIYVAKDRVKQHIVTTSPHLESKVIVEPYMFFRPKKSIRLTDRLNLADGDMFFSTLQTLTVSVNTVGIMGKGLASRAKYQFPDVYVRYQDLCRKKSLKLGRPALYKREFEVPERDAADVVDGKWFLLFPTKGHWRNDSTLPPIEEGLQWIVDNYHKEAIESLAIPALGCGLGNLSWAEVGPLMCRYLSRIEIVCTIYLPQGKEIPAEQLSFNYLMR
jgi:hypothetical protein